MLDGIEEASAVLADAYTRQHAHGPALAALRTSVAAHDSLLGNEARRRTAVLQLREQQAQISFLTQQNLLQQQTQEPDHLHTRQQLAGGVALLLLLLAGDRCAALAQLPAAGGRRGCPVAAARRRPAR